LKISKDYQRKIKMLRLSLMILMGMLLNITAAHATLLSTDWKTAGDNFVTVDTNSKLEWLDLTQTSNHSYNDVVANLGTGGLFEGWTLATESDVNTLLTHAGVPLPYSLGNDATIAAETASLLQLIGAQQNPTPQSSTSRGLISDLIPSSGSHQYLLTGANTANSFYQTGFGTRSDTNIDPAIGTYLVRAASIPEPATLALMGLGLAGIGYKQRKSA
jgi:hypothetical protein